MLETILDTLRTRGLDLALKTGAGRWSLLFFAFFLWHSARGLRHAFQAVALRWRYPDYPRADVWRLARRSLRWTPLLLVLALGFGWLAWVTDLPYQRLARVVTAGELRVVPLGRGRVRATFLPAHPPLQRLRTTGSGHRVFLVGVIVDCPRWMNWVLWSSRHRPLGIDFMKQPMDLPTETRLRQRWQNRADIGFRVMDTLSRYLHLCRTRIADSHPVPLRQARYIVLATSKGYILELVAQR